MTPLVSTSSALKGVGCAGPRLRLAKERGEEPGIKFKSKQKRQLLTQGFQSVEFVKQVMAKQNRKGERQAPPPPRQHLPLSSWADQMIRLPQRAGAITPCDVQQLRSYKLTLRVASEGGANDRKVGGKPKVIKNCQPPVLPSVKLALAYSMPGPFSHASPGDRRRSVDCHGRVSPMTHSLSSASSI